MHATLCCFSNYVFSNEAEWGKGAPPLPKGIVEQSRVRGIISTANLLAACVGLIVIGASTWVARKQQNPGIFALFQVDLQLLSSPLYFAVVFFASGLAMVLFGAAIGAGPLAEGLASGYILQDQRKLFISYQILLFLSLIGLCFTIVGSMTPLMNFKGQHSIDPGVWNRMSPSLVCEYEQANECGGVNTGSCTLNAPSTVTQTQTCPGLFCAKFCAKNNSSSTLDCSRCKQLRKADECRAHELNANRQTGCGGLLLNDARVLLYFILVVSAIGLGTILSVAVVDVMASSS